ncbi:MAG TPA: fluoride efflux transporter CrcB [Puia sp.]|nr:fluoride efflux transporter CrcB [Puia sp.]
MMLRNILIVGFGGGLGSIARYLCQKYVRELYFHPFPLGTFLVNISGCFLIGLFYGLMEKGNLLSPEWRLLLMTGFCGGYTTFSAFALENALLIKSGQIILFGLYAAGSVFLGIVATFLGALIVFK